MKAITQMNNKIILLSLTAVTLLYPLAAMAQITGSDYSYLGINGNIGLTDDDNTSLEDFGILVNTKIPITPNLSLRPAVILADDTSFLIPVTFNFSFSRTQAIVPFVGGGVVFGPKDGLLLSSGVEVPLGDEFLVNGGINASFIDGKTNAGLYFGLGFIFPQD